MALYQEDRSINYSPNLWYRGLPLQHVKREDSESRQIVYSFSSEQPVRRWFGKEVLLHTDEAVDLSRLREMGSLLFNHWPSKILGPVDDARLQDARGVAEATLDEDELGNWALRKVKSRSLRGVSVGYDVKEFRQVQDKETQDFDGGRLVVEGPGFVATRWAPIETSLTAIPADASVGVGRSAVRSLEGIYIVTSSGRKVFDLGRATSTEDRNMPQDPTAGTTNQDQEPPKAQPPVSPTSPPVDERAIVRAHMETLKPVFERAAGLEQRGYPGITKRVQDLACELRSVQEIQDAILDHIQNTRAAATPPTEPTLDGDGAQEGAKRKLDEMDGAAFSDMLSSPAMG